MKSKYGAVICAVGLITSLGCGEKEESSTESGKESAEATKTVPAKANPSVWVDMELPDLGLIASVPGNAKFTTSGGIRTPDWSCTLSISEKKSHSGSYANTLMNVEKGNNGGPLKEMVKNEKTDEDNWFLQWTTEKGKFGYATNKKIGDRVYTSAYYMNTEQEKLDCSLKIFASLKAK